MFSENIGGWSNINILGQASTGKVVLKIPSKNISFSTNPYLAEYRIADYLSRKELCPTPLATGFLDEESHIPYILYRYVEGLIYESPTDISTSHLDSLREALDHLAKTRPPDIMDYSEPSSMLGHISKVLEFPNIRPERIPQKFCNLLNELKAFCFKLMDILDGMCKWSRQTIHGDLQESNIVFQDNKAIFLDLGRCSIAEPLYDIAYFLVQAPGPSLTCPKEFILDEAELATVEDLTPIALLSVAAWTLNRLINQEMGLIEENLVSLQATQEMHSYLNTKHSELRSLINHWK